MIALNRIFPAMFRLDSTQPIVADGGRLAAVYLPASCSDIPAIVERKTQVVLADDAPPMVEILPPSRRRAERVRERLADEVILALAPTLFDPDGARLSPQVACDPYLHAIAQTIRCGFRHGFAPPGAYLESLAPQIAEHLNRFYPVRMRKRESRGLSPNRLTRVLAIVEERLGASLAVEEMASAVHLSPYHFARMFRRSTGMSPHAFLTHRRIERAKHLLATTSLSMADIATVVGYRNQAHFSRAFQSVAGVVPRRYRTQARIDAGGVHRVPERGGLQAADGL
jgi:AraC family transcriptional regulator